LPSPRQQLVPLTGSQSIAEVFAARIALSPEAIAYRDFDSRMKGWKSHTWREMAELVGRVRGAVLREGLARGDRVAIMLKNSKEWIAFDQGAFAEGLVTVPLFVDDRPDNVAYILNDAGVKLLFVEGEDHLKRLKPVAGEIPGVKRIVTVKAVEDSGDPRVQAMAEWLAPGPVTAPPVEVDAKSLATIVYTSGTTGRPKGVMLSHDNILSNVKACLGAYDVFTDDVFLSFLPMSHMFERTVGYYLTMVAGATVAIARSIPQLSEDFKSVRPTIIVSVPRIFERLNAAVRNQLKDAGPRKRQLFEFSHGVGWKLFLWRQGRGAWHASFLLWPLLKALVANKLLARFGGRLRLCISGGAALNPQIAQTFIGLGLPICQGYGLTEASPVVSVNRLDRNDPVSIGVVLPGIEIEFGENDVLRVRGPNVMMGYWNNPEATAKAIDSEGWLDSGDQATHVDGIIHITGRIKEIIVLGNGEKVPPTDMELAIQLDPLVEQVMIVGEGMPFLGALVVLNMEEWFKVAQQNGLVADPNGENRDRAEKLVVARIAERVKEFPGYAQVRRVALLTDAWAVDNGLLTPTLKLKRNVILERFKDRLAAMYRGHID
jgi:long-chain acyl-CoA synthetase